MVELSVVLSSSPLLLLSPHSSVAHPRSILSHSLSCLVSICVRTPLKRGALGANPAWFVDKSAYPVALRAALGYHYQDRINFGFSPFVLVICSFTFVPLKLEIYLRQHYME